MEKFIDLVSWVKTGACSSCNSYIYTIPVAVDADIEAHLAPIGPLTYDLSKYKIVKLETDFILISSRLTTNKITVKFKSKADETKGIFDTHLARYISAKLGQEIEV
jgi:hypothetical protein